MDHFNEVFTVANSIFSISTRAKDWPAVLLVRKSTGDAELKYTEIPSLLTSGMRRGI